MQDADIKQKTMLIRINQLYHEDITPQELYEATRGVWPVGERREQAELAMAVFEGVILEVYRIHQWHPAGTTEYQTRDGEDFVDCGRWEFTGTLATDVRSHYIGQSVKHYLRYGNAHSCVYINM